jgi:hypothetical protein
MLGHKVIFGDDEFSRDRCSSRNEMVGKAATEDSFFVDLRCAPIQLGFHIEDFANRIHCDVRWTNFAIRQFSWP